MKLNHKKIELAMAHKPVRLKDLLAEAGISRQTFYGVMHGKRCTPYTAGRLARALGVDAEDILEEATS